MRRVRSAAATALLALCGSLDRFDQIGCRLRIARLALWVEGPRRPDPDDMRRRHGGDTQ